MRRDIGDNGSMTETPAPQDKATMRRAPKMPVFLVVGAGLGAIVTFILTALFPSDPQVGFGALFGYFLLYGIPAGLVLGAVVGLILDRRSRRQATGVMVERESVEEEPEPLPAAEPLAELDAEPLEPGTDDTER
jgi:hypothetical protein